MQSFWLRHMKPLLVAAIVVVVLIVIAVTGFLVSAGQRHFHATAPATSRHHVVASTAKSSTSKLVFRWPTLLTPPDTAIQATVAANAERSAEDSPPIPQVPEPPAALSRDFPAISHAERQDPATYAEAFTTELLDLDYATESRSALLSWVVSESAPDTFPATPRWLEVESCFVSIGTAELNAQQGGRSPIATVSGWAADAAGNVRWSVAHVSAHTTAEWGDAVAAGWQPRDPRAIDERVLGDLTVRAGSNPPTTEPFSLILGLGSSFYHQGYGVSLLGDWRV